MSPGTRSSGVSDLRPDGTGLDSLTEKLREKKKDNNVNVNTYVPISFLSTSPVADGDWSFTRYEIQRYIPSNYIINPTRPATTTAATDPPIREAAPVYVAMGLLTLLPLHGDQSAAPVPVGAAA